jgi:hypothetical protein
MKPGIWQYDLPIEFAFGPGATLAAAQWIKNTFTLNNFND